MKIIFNYDEAITNLKEQLGEKIFKQVEQWALHKVSNYASIFQTKACIFIALHNWPFNLPDISNRADLGYFLSKYLITCKEEYLKTPIIKKSLLMSILED